MIGLKQLSLVALLMSSLPAFGYQLTCVRDYSAVDGDKTKIELNGEGAGKPFTLKINTQTESRAASRKLETVNRALTCEFPTKDHHEVNCKGPFPVTIVISNTRLGEMVRVQEGLDKKVYSFKNGPIGPEATKSGCELKE